MSAASARQHARRLRRKYSIAGKADVEGLARTLGLTVQRTGDIPAGVSGVLVTRQDRSWICVREDEPSQRQRFTMAHELGHWYLNHQSQDGRHVHVNRGTMVSMRGRLASEGVDDKEVEANQFAAELLMPGQEVRDEVLKLPRPLREQDISDLAEHFDVSAQAMSFRLRNLRLA
jgi:Zn-dependent peptidase ImmA (M78 family)